MAVALDKAARGRTLDPNEARIVRTIHGEGTKISIVHNTEFEFEESGERNPGFEVVGRPPAPTTEDQRNAIINRLDAADVGGARGTKDELIVRQALLAETPEGTVKVFRTADRQSIRGLARLAQPPIPVDDLGGYDNVSEYLHYERGTHRFTIEVEGRQLVVQPIEDIRSGLTARPGGKGKPRLPRSSLTKAEKKRIRREGPAKPGTPENAPVEPGKGPGEGMVTPEPAGTAPPAELPGAVEPPAAAEVPNAPRMGIPVGLSRAAAGAGVVIEGLGLLGALKMGHDFGKAMEFHDALVSGDYFNKFWAEIGSYPDGTRITFEGSQGTLDMSRGIAIRFDAGWTLRMVSSPKGGLGMEIIDTDGSGGRIDKTGVHQFGPPA